MTTLRGFVSFGLIAVIVIALTILIGFGSHATPHMSTPLPSLESTSSDALTAPTASGQTESNQKPVPSAIIDQSSLTSTSTNPTITGSTANWDAETSTIQIRIYQEGKMVWESGFFAIGPAGSWAIPSYQGPLLPGLYTVYAYDNHDNLLTKGTLIILKPAQPI